MMGRAAIRVVVVDDHAVVREGLKRILSDAGDIVVAGEAANDQEALETVRGVNCDVVVTDLSMPGRGGLDLLRDLRREKPRLPVLILSVHGEQQFVVRSLKAGAAGYLTKDSPTEELVRAVRRVSAGRRYVSPAIAEALADHLQSGGGDGSHDQLSNREFQVLRLMATGLTSTEIGRELSLSIKTVSTYRTRLLAKLGLRSNGELIAYAIRNGLAE